MLAKGVVKSVQHGVFAFTESTEQNITIAPVNLDKAVLIVDIGGTEDVIYGTQYMSPMYSYFASSSCVTIATAAPYGGFPDFRASWQVIEFY